MNRKQLRNAGATTIPRVTISIKNLAPVLGKDRAGTSAQTYIAADDDNIFTEVIRGTLDQLGVNRTDLAAAMVFHAINSMFPPDKGMDFRRMVAWGISVGASYKIESNEVQDHDKDGKLTGETVLELGVRAHPAFPPLVPIAPEQPATGPTRVWRPGDPV